jgi:hypothetical protein
MEKRSRRRIRDLVALPAFQGLSQNEIGCARISMMARSTKAPFKGRIQKRKTNHLQIITFGLQRTAGPYKRATNGRTLTCLLWERMLKEETQHFPRGVRSSRISVGASRAASRPRVSSSMNVPVLKNSASARIDMDRAGKGVSSGYPPAMHLLLRARCSHRLLKNMIAVVWMHRDVAITVKNNGRDRWPVT